MWVRFWSVNQEPSPLLEVDYEIPIPLGAVVVHMQ